MPLRARARPVLTSVRRLATERSATLRPAVEEDLVPCADTCVSCLSSSGSCGRSPSLVLLCSLLFLPGSELGCSLVCLGYFFSSSPYVTTLLFMSEMLLDCNPSSNPATPKPRFAILIAMQSVLGLWHRPRPNLSSSIEPSTPSLLSFHSSLF